jgi:hypothetical protein
VKSGSLAGKKVIHTSLASCATMPTWHSRCVVFRLPASHDHVYNKFLGFLLSVKRKALRKGKMMSGLRIRYIFCRSSWKHGDIDC